MRCDKFSVSFSSGVFDSLVDFSIKLFSLIYVKLAINIIGEVLVLDALPFVVVCLGIVDV